MVVARRGLVDHVFQSGPGWRPVSRTIWPDLKTSLRGKLVAMSRGKPAATTAITQGSQ